MIYNIIKLLDKYDEILQTWLLLLASVHVSKCTCIAFIPNLGRWLDVILVCMRHTSTWGRLEHWYEVAEVLRNDFHLLVGNLNFVHKQSKLVKYFVKCGLGI